MASVDPGASAAIWRKVAALASLLRYMATPVETTTAGRPGSKPAAGSCSHHDPPASKSTGYQPEPLWDTEAQFDQTLSLPRLGAGLVDLENPEARGNVGPALGKGVQAGAQDDVLGDALFGLLGHQVLDETSPGDNGGPKRPGAGRVHIRAAPPSVVGIGQLQPDHVLEHMGRRVDLDVHGPPQGHPYRAALRPGGLFGFHDTAS